MSGPKDRSGERKITGPGYEGALAQALKAARLSAEAASRDKPVERQPEDKPVRQGGALTIHADNELFRAACEGVTPLAKFDVVGNSLHSATKASERNADSDGKGRPASHIHSAGEPQKPIPNTNKHEPSPTKPHKKPKGGKQEKVKKQQQHPLANRSQGVGQNPRGQRDVPEMIRQVQPGSSVKKIFIRGSYIQNGQRQKNANSRPNKKEPSELRVKGDVSVQESVLATSDSHWLKNPVAIREFYVPNTTEHEVDLVIGFDFGTSFCKVVVRETGNGRAWAVPFSPGSTNPYLLSTAVWMENSVYGLST